MGLYESATLLGAIGLLTVVAGFLANALRFRIDPLEPPVIYPRVPLIGHIIGSLMGGTTYFKELQSVPLVAVLWTAEYLMDYAVKSMDMPYSRYQC